MEYLISLEKIRELIQKERYEYYTHALIEAKKEGIEPEDIVYVILTGKIIEEYPDRCRLLIYGEMLNELPLHVVCDFSNQDFIYIPTVYIATDEEWADNYQRRKTKGEK